MVTQINLTDIEVESLIGTLAFITDKLGIEKTEELQTIYDKLTNRAIYGESEPIKGFSLVVESPDDLVLKFEGKEFLRVDLPEKGTSWN